MKKLIFLFALIPTLSSYCQPSLPKTNIKAPQIKVDEWVNNDITENDLRGKMIVLEFWFIRCAPCVAAIPHLNKIADKYKNDNVVFLAITFDRKEEVQKFLTTMYMASHVGTDTLSTTIRAFDISMFPTTVVIDTNGIIAWAGYPFQLESILDTLVKNHSNLISDTKSFETKLRNSSYSLDVKVHNLVTGDGAFTQHTNDGIIIFNKTIKEIISEQMDVSEARIITTGTYFDENLDATLKAISKTATPENNKEILLYLLQKQLNITIKETKKDTNVWLMTLHSDSLLSQYKNTGIESGTSSNGKEWKGNNISINKLVTVLEDEFQILIDCPVPLRNNYNYKIPLGNWEEAVKVLENTYGFKFYQSPVKTDFVTVDFTNMNRNGLDK